MLANALLNAGVSQAEAGAMDAAARTAAAATAGTKAPSTATWTEVVDRMSRPPNAPTGEAPPMAYRSFSQMKTLRGFSVGEVISALQKSIRRSDEVGAVSWAAELDQSGFTSHVWNRLEVICSEDIGPAWPIGPAVIAALRSNYERSMKRTQNGTERIFLAHAAILMARAPKSRVTDAAIWATYGYEEPMVPEIPDEALDFHTERGRSMGRRAGTKAGDDHWTDEASKLLDPQTGEAVDEKADLGPFYDRYWRANEATYFDVRRGATTTTKPGEAARPKLKTDKPEGLFGEEGGPTDG